MSALRRLHEDEGGMEALQVVIILAIAAIALTLIKQAWGPIKTWFRKSVAEIIAWSD
jgi:hypothetical protein